jgi:hypothetical protein
MEKQLNYYERKDSLPKDLVCADDDRLLTILHVVLNLQDTMHPQPVAGSPLKP